MDYFFKAIDLISFILIIWYLPPVREKMRSMDQNRLQKISASDYIEKQRRLRDTNALRGLTLIALTLVLDVQRFMYSVPKIVPLPLALATICELVCAFAAFFIFGNAIDNHRQTDTEVLTKERNRLLKATKAMSHTA